MIAPDPFASPKTSAEPQVFDFEDAEIIRRTHLRAEERVRTAAAWLMSTGIVLMLSATVALPMALTGPARGLATVLTMLALAAIYTSLGIGAWLLRSPFHFVGALAAVPSLVFFPIGTWIGARMIHAFLCARGRFVFTPPYREVVLATPAIHVRYWLIVVTVALPWVLIFGAAIVYQFVATAR